MPFRNQKALGVQITDSTVKVVELNPKPARPEVRAFALFNLPAADRARALAILPAALQGRGISPSPPHLVFSGGGTDHQLLSYPPMSQGDLEAVLGREVRKAQETAGAELCHGYRLYRRVHKGAQVPSEVLLATAPRQEAEGLAAEVGLALKPPRLLLTVPIALETLYRRQFPREEVLLGLHLDSPLSYVLLLHRGALAFAREIPLDAGPQAPAEPLRAALRREVDRSLLYLRQRFRGREPRQLVLSGEREDLATFQAPLTEGTTLQGSLLSLDGILDLSPLGRRSSQFRKALPQLVIPLGAALAPSGRGVLSLSVAGATPKGGGQARKVAVGALAAGVLLMGAWKYMGLLRSEAAIKKTLALHQGQLQEVRSKSNEIEAVQRQAAEARTREGFLRLRQENGALWAGLLREVGAYATDHMNLIQVEIRRDKEDWTVVVLGEFTDVPVVEATRELNRFYTRLREAPYLESLELRPLTPQGVGAAAQERGEGGQVRSYFAQIYERIATETAAKAFVPPATPPKNTRMGFEIRGKLAWRPFGIQP